MTVESHWPTRLRATGQRITQQIATLRHATALRLAMSLFAVFCLVLMAGLGITYAQVRAEFEQRVEKSLDRHADDLRVAVVERAAQTPATPQTAIWQAEVTRQALRLAADDRVVVWLGNDGRQAGNARVNDPDRPTHSLERRAGFGDLEDDGYITKLFIEPDGRLLIGETRDPLRDVEEIFLAVLLLTIVPTLAATGILGTVIALGTMRRVRSIEAVLAKLAQGDFEARSWDRMQHDDLGRLARAVDDMAAAQARLVAGMQRVTANIAHDLRTPLQRIRAHLDDAFISTTTATRTTALELADNEIDSALRVFDALLQIVRIDAGSPALSFVPTDLATVSAQLVDLYQPTFEETGRSLSANGFDEPAWTLVEPTLFGQLLANLLENALRHTPTGSRTAVSLRVTNAAIIVSVTDDGPGIAPEDHSRMLEPLVRGDLSRSTEGHGLGLALVAAIARLHRATLCLEPAHPEQPRPGLRVSIEFSRKDDVQRRTRNPTSTSA